MLISAVVVVAFLKWHIKLTQCYTQKCNLKIGGDQTVGYKNILFFDGLSQKSFMKVRF